jgi:hypothetical protein
MSHEGNNVVEVAIYSECDWPGRIFSLAAGLGVDMRDVDGDLAVERHVHLRRLRSRPGLGIVEPLLGEAQAS